MTHSTDRATAAFFSEINAALHRANAVAQYITDRKGNKVRVFTKDAPCTMGIIRDALWGKRVVTEEEMLEAVGKNVFQYMLQQGYIRKDAHGADWFWITKSGGAAYGLARPMNGAVEFANDKA